MLSQETLDAYRRMTPGERLAIALEMTQANLSALLEGTPSVVARRFELLRRENDLRNEAIRRAISLTRRRP
ncbi:MAG: hypothetical protein RLZZ326_3563 [Planctomycetota bacterium]|jgi:hypothetical protein